MSQRALITGISGFAGGFLAEHLLDAGDEVLGTSPDGQWMDSSPGGLEDRVEIIPWDLSRHSGPDLAIRRVIEHFQPEVIYHLAALSIPSDCGLESPTDAALSVNVVGTAEVLALADSLCDSQSVPPRFLLASSSHVYRPVQFDSPMADETAPLGPLYGYGQSKLAAERLVGNVARRGRFQVVIARPFQHTGPRQSNRMMLPEWSCQLAAGGDKSARDMPIEVHTLDAIVDLSDVRDVVRAYRLLLQSDRDAMIYNIGSGNARRSGDLLDLLMQFGGSRREVVELSPGAKQDPIADISRLQSETGWRPEIPIEQTVEDTLRYWQERLGPTQQ
ncbi:MAG: GDP-mannose 4,6-dehydratase [Pirellulales bacterium]|nr:GDP-mannose 4,6-dehydratase [Pirellulales bacterium]